ncbi:hypothetical protein EC968_001463 [Mortierella alpina]|nr:hypothetical protein EC968_001463 [Mortierella alpina]
MSTSAARTLAILARRRPLWTRCCCLQSQVRFRSSASSAVHSSDWESPTASAVAQLSETRNQLQPVSSLDLLESSIPSETFKEAKKGRPRTLARKTSEESTSTVTSPETLGDHEANSSKRLAKPRSIRMTYQGQATGDWHSYSQELEPAPFPYDIHSSMPYVNRDFPARKSNVGNSPNGGGSHNNLQSFEDLDHNTDSTIYRGTLFEYQTQEILRDCLGIYTQRSAGNNDYGVDLRGTWFLPLSASPKPGDMVRHLKVIVQCKRMNSKIGPKFVRELQGSLSYESQPTMAILAVSSEFTKQALLPYAKSLWPMALVVIDTKTNECRKLMWNRAAEKVMHGVQIGTRWMSGEGEQMESRPVLCFQGKVIERLPGPYLNEGVQLNADVKKATAPLVASLVDYAIPDWNIETDPGFLHVVPDARSGLEHTVDDDDDDISHHQNSKYLELLTWSPPIQESLSEIEE